MQCLLVDDEPLALDLLSSYIAKVEGLKLVKKCSNALDAFSFLQHQHVDLLFLDIQMPQITGLDLVKSLKVKPQIILTTAYREYATDAFDLDVLDYLLKPIHFDRFLQALGKAYRYKLISPRDINTSQQSVAEEPYVYLKEEREMVKVYLKDILYIESLQNYVRVRTANQQVVTYQKLSYLEQKLPEHQFMRVHRSFIVAIDKIVSFNAASLKIGNVDIPIGRNYKIQVLKVLNRSNVLL